MAKKKIKKKKKRIVKRTRKKKSKKKTEKRYTQKQKKLIRLISENIGNKGFTKTMKAMMLEAGYSPSMAKRQQSTLESIKGETKTLMRSLEDERDAAIKAMQGKRRKAKYRDLSESVAKLTKVIQLLGGKPTEIIPQPILKLPEDE